MNTETLTETPPGIDAAPEPPFQWPVFWRRWWILLTGFIGVLGFDQVVKWLVVTRLLPGESWHVLPSVSSFIRVTHSFNTGAAFGMFPMMSDIFLGLAILAVIAFVIYYPQLPAHAVFSRIGMGIITGGAMSNAIDRLSRGHVVDYVHVQFTPQFANISNFADHAIVLGMLALVVEQSVFEYRETRAQAAGAAAVEPLEDDSPAEETHADAGLPPADMVAAAPESDPDGEMSDRSSSS